MSFLSFWRWLLRVVVRQGAGSFSLLLKRKQRLFSRSGIALFFYGYEALFAPLVSAAAQLNGQTQQAAVAVQQVYVLYVPQAGERLAEVAQRFDVAEAQLLASI